jgi:argininosuccinate synthase
MKVVLAYSGGLDTSVILKWLQNEYSAEVVTFTADLGQGDEVELARKKALSCGVASENIYIEDLREDLVRDYAMPVFRANAAYEGYYLMGTPIARPLVARRQIEIARAVGADCVAHGATGKGNDQLRFELSYLALAPDIKVIAPWREWHFKGRSDLVRYAEAHQIPVARDTSGAPAYSADGNLLHISAEGNELEDPWVTPEREVFTRTAELQEAPDTPETIVIEFLRGDPISLNGQPLSPAALLSELNRLGGKHGIGRLDIVDSRRTGMKSRGIFETPGGMIWQIAHRAMESITLDHAEISLKDQLMPQYAEMIYNGVWFSPERRMMQALIDTSQEFVTGTVRAKLYRGNVVVEGRQSAFSLYSKDYVTFESDDVYSGADASGYITINALRLRLLARKRPTVWNM